MQNFLCFPFFCCRAVQASGRDAEKIMKPKIYIETSFISYLTARPSRDLIIAAHQQITHEWWDKRRENFDLYISQLVIREAGGGNPEAAAKRLAVLQDIPLMEMNETAMFLGEQLVMQHAVPKGWEEDALHIAVAVVNGADYLLTWNCTHIGNAERRNLIAEVCHNNGCELPVICTPEELIGE